MAIVRDRALLTSPDPPPADRPLLNKGGESVLSPFVQGGRDLLLIAGGHFPQASPSASELLPVPPLRFGGESQAGDLNDCCPIQMPIRSERLPPTLLPALRFGRQVASADKLAPSRSASHIGKTVEGMDADLRCV